MDATAFDAIPSRASGPADGIWKTEVLVVVEEYSASGVIRTWSQARQVVWATRDFFDFERATRYWVVPV